MSTKKEVEPVRSYDNWSHCYLTKISPTEWEMPPGFSDRYNGILAQEAALRAMLNGVAAFVAQQQTALENEKRACWESLRVATGSSADAQMSLEGNMRKLLIHIASEPKPAKIVITEPASVR